MKFLKAALLLNLALIANIGHTSEIPEAGSSWVVNDDETLYVNDGDVFNLASLNITSGGGLDIFGNTQNVSFSIIANDFINIDGYLNFFVSNTTLKANDISFSGILNIVGGGGVTFITANSLNFSGSVLFDGMPPLPPSDGPLTGPILPPKIVLAAVPEPKSYTLLLAGLGLMIIVSRRWLI